MKLCDFGYASSFSRKKMSKSFCGTLDYVSPEMVEDKPYDNSVDVWSVGVLTYELIVGHAPFAAKNQEDTLRAV